MKNQRKGVLITASVSPAPQLLGVTGHCPASRSSAANATKPASSACLLGAGCVRASTHERRVHAYVRASARTHMTSSVALLCAV